MNFFPFSLTMKNKKGRSSSAFQFSVAMQNETSNVLPQPQLWIREHQQGPKIVPTFSITKTNMVDLRLRMPPESKKIVAFVCHAF